MANHLYYGDNLQVLRDSIKDESVDLIYLDPPFNSSANYNILFKSPKGDQSTAQIEAFEDTWHWTHEAEKAFDEVMQSGNLDAAEMLRAMRDFLKENDMMAYLTMMAVRLIELHRVLKPTGSIYLHCDPTASHYLKILMDAIFGKTNFLNEVIWKRTGSHGGAKRWGPVHDTIIFYSKSENYIWNRVSQSYDESYIDKFYRFEDKKGRYRLVSLTGAGTRNGESGNPWKGINPTEKGRHWAIPVNYLERIGVSYPTENLSIQEKLDFLDAIGIIDWPKKGNVPQFKMYLDREFGTTIQDIVTDVPPISAQAQERLGYPTQKPVSLLERILNASSSTGDTVLDPFCGCGTTIHAAEKLGRNWIGIDITHLSISLIEKRLKDAFPSVKFETHGTPKDLEGARALAELDKYQFQWWATSLIDATPYGGKKKGADGGIDGVIYFKGEKNVTERAIVSVKGGNSVSVAMIRDLGHVIEREKAKIGIFVCLAKPTKDMITEAVKAGFYEANGFKVPKIQILTIEELFQDKKPQIPLIQTIFKQAAIEETAKQDKLI